MKKFASLILSLALVLGLAAPALATQLSTAAEDTEVSQVTYSSGVSEGYLVEVPATIAAGSSTAYNIKVTGAWDVDKTLTVTTPGTVTLTDSESGEAVTANVTFNGITQGGSRAHDFNGDNAITQSISVAAPQNALFGTWTGTLTYSVSFHTAALMGITAAWKSTAPTSPAVGSAVDKDTIQVTASYDNNTSVTLDSDDFTVSPTTWAANTTSITVSYTKDSVTKTADLAFTGTVKKPLSSVMISGASDWNTFVDAYNADDGTYTDTVSVIMLGDVDECDVWTPKVKSLGSVDRPFGGTVSVGAAFENMETRSLFGYLDGATIENSTFKDSIVSAPLINQTSGTVTFKNCQFLNSQYSYLIDTVSSGTVVMNDCCFSGFKVASNYVIKTVNTNATVTFEECQWEVTTSGTPIANSNLKENGSGTVTVGTGCTGFGS